MAPGHAPHQVLAEPCACRQLWMCLQVAEGSPWYVHVRGMQVDLLTDGNKTLAAMLPDIKINKRK